MALSQEQIAKLKKQYGFSGGDIGGTKPGTVGELLGSSFSKKKEETKQTFGQDLAGDVAQTGRALKNIVSETGERIGEAKRAEAEGRQSGLRGMAQSVGLTMGAAARGVGEIFKGGVKAVLPQGAEEVVKSSLETAIKPVVGTAMQLPFVKDFFENYESLSEDQKRDVDALFGAGSLATELATGPLAGRAVRTTAKAGARVAQEGIEDTVKFGGEVIDKAKKVTPRITEKLLAKEPNLVEATGQVLQGQTKDIAKGVEALSAVDKTGVKTFNDLQNKITGKITELSQKVDADLGKDATKYSLKDLQVVGKTKLGKSVSSDYISTALNQLDELYTTIGDKVKSADVKDLIKSAKSDGLTRLEVNDISRIYGQEFGQKAFSKLGDPLTSVNAQLFENVRSGLKNVARKGIGGKEAQLADKTMSTLYNTERLISKNVEAVNKLRQKIQERGLLEKTGHIISKYADILTGGSVRGLVGGLLPRGAGYKVMNALDLEERLIKNLNIIEKATAGKTAKEIEEILKTLIP